MAGPPRVWSTHISEPESRPVLVPAGNKVQKKTLTKPIKKAEKLAKEEITESKDGGKLVKLTSPKSPTPVVTPVPQPLPQCPHLSSSILRRNVSMTASCSSDASSSDSSSLSRASSSSGKKVFAARRSGGSAVRRKQCVEKVENGEPVLAGNGCLEGKKRCAWVTPNTDPCYAAFHDEEWGVSVHDDKKLFEFLSLSGALAELTWPAILTKRHIFREVFLDFDPIAVSKLNEKKVATPGSLASSLLSELKLRSIIENARQICKIRDEFGSFDKYIWNFVNHKPVVSQFRYPRQVPVKTPKAEVISKDLVKRGFRSVGPTVIYSFMQAAGLTNDHIVSCFRFQECMAGAEVEEKDDMKTKGKN
ncbi:uncharacterized protein LOC110821052 [Carica papaya]|uniref:uncharacterized protein LOC110821052 n=1 Tax=Carica papaya TaxID=3649 RepID=UPI000B8CA25B|nr:uncharacterized protein LOC110821052 [Carica papaya]